MTSFFSFKKVLIETQEYETFYQGKFFATLASDKIFIIKIKPKKYALVNYAKFVFIDLY